jgi:glycosyltransferase involved in cell wall biosynthesis
LGLILYKCVRIIPSGFLKKVCLKRKIEMKIAIDAAGPLGSFEKGGISYFLGDFLSSLKDVDKKNSYLVFGYFWHNYKEKKRNISIPESENFQLRTLPLPRRVVKNIEEGLHLPVIEQFLKKEGISIFHSISAQEMPYFKRIKTVYSIYDLAFEINPSWYKDKYYTYIYKSAVRADVIVSSSYSTKKDIVQIYGIEPEKVRVVYLGVNRKIFNTAVDSRCEYFMKKYDIPEMFILTVATSVKRKNIPVLLEVYGNLSKKGIREKMVVVAGSQPVKEEITEMVKEKNMQDNVLCLSEVTIDSLTCLYKKADLFVFPSLYEGFGLPVLEAMACGCPVIVSNVSSLPEIAGDAGLLIDPHSVDEIASAIENVLSDSQLREDMKQKGLERAKQFSWEKTAEDILNIYKDVFEKEEGI